MLKEGSKVPTAPPARAIPCQLALLEVVARWAVEAAAVDISLRLRRRFEVVPPIIAQSACCSGRQRQKRDDTGCGEQAGAAGGGEFMLPLSTC